MKFPDAPLCSTARSPATSTMRHLGAENDLQQVTEIARHMVLRWG
jgi:hypothetical protein